MEIEKKKINAKNYHWKELHGLKNIMNAVKGKETKGEVSSVDNAKDAPVFDSFSPIYQYVEEGVEMDDGTVLLCCSVSSFVGTFASHDRIESKFYLLTPR